MLVIVIILVVGSGIWDNHRDDEQEKCFAQNFSRLSHTLKDRGGIAQAESDANAKLLLTSLGASEVLTEDERKRIAKYIDATVKPANELTKKQQRMIILDYVDSIISVKTARTAHPIETFPTGKCD